MPLFNPVLTGSVEVPFSNRTRHYWAVPTENEKVRETSYRDQALNLAATVVAGTAIYHSPRIAKKNPVNFWFNAARTVEEFFPFRIPATFRVSELLSPSLHRTNPHTILLSGMKPIDKLRTNHYLKQFLGVSKDVDINKFTEIMFSPEEKGPFGKLYGINKAGGKTLLHEKVRAIRPGRLFEAYTSVVSPGTHGDVRVARSIFGGIKNTRWLPIATQGRVKDVIMAGRTYAAFSVQRLGELMERAGEEMAIPSFNIGKHHFRGGSLKGLLGNVGIKLKPSRGAFGRTLFGYSKFALLMGGSSLFVSQLDAWRNSDNAASRMAAVVGTTGILSKLGHRIAKRIGKNPLKGGLIGAAVSVAQFFPAFSSGIKPGVAGMFPRLNMMRSRIGESFLFNDIRRWFEDTMPGSTGVGTSIFMGGLITAGIYAQQRHVHEKAGTLLPLVRKDIYPQVRELQGEVFNDLKLGSYNTWKTGRTSAKNKTIISGHLDDMIKTRDNDVGRLFADSSRAEAMDVAYRVRERILSQHKRPFLKGSLFKRELQRMSHAAKVGSAGGILRTAGVAALGWFVLTGGLGTKETPEDLEATYSGEKLVPVRRGRAWEMGATPYEGTDVLYWRQHWYARMVAKARTSGEGRGPLREWLEKNFTYNIERENYENRPHAISSAAFDEAPFIYPIIKPLGDLIKPAKLMHVEDWARVNDKGQIELKYVESALTPSPSTELGGLAPGAPVSPYSSTQLMRRMFYETSELSGLVGWAGQGLYTMASDAQLPFAEDAVLSSASQIGSARKAFWDEQTGGAFLGIPLMSESVRRFLPAYPSHIDTYNPIENALPDWLPKDLKYGDPYSNLRYGLGEERLPGPLYDELYNTGGEYGVEDRLRILADVASYSKGYRDTAREARGIMRDDPMSPVSQDMADTIARLAAKRNKIDFDYYQNRPSGYGVFDSRGNIRDINESAKSKGAFRRTLGRVWEGFAHGTGKVLAPIEHVAPGGISPWSKLIHQRDPVEHYEQTKVYGSQYRFWSHPWKNWLRPALSSARRNWFGEDYIPGHIQEVRDTQEYYDKLKWYKYQQLSSAAAQAGQLQLASQYRRVMKSTVHGANPYSGDSSMKYSLPYSDRSYFNAFSQAKSQQTQGNILELLPTNQRSMYEGVWNRERMQMLENTDPMSEELQNLRVLAMAEGKPINEDLYAEYVHKGAGMSYADWARMKEAETFFHNRQMPQPDWIGWRPDVDLEDIKLMQVQQRGQDHHAYDIFRSRVTALKRKPYLEGSLANMNASQDRSVQNQNPTYMTRGLRDIMDFRDMGNYDISRSYNSPYRSTSAVDLSVNVAPVVNTQEMFS